jgi:hypothetical protein
MTENMGLALVGIAFTLIQGLCFFILVGIKADITEIWKRIYNHYHEIECTNNDCKKVKTGNVIIPHEGA